MLINGRRVQVKGVCDHHDLGCLGSAVNRRAIQRQLEILKGMGCNAIRTSHNPPDPALLDLCDAMGFVVMDEAFDEWKTQQDAAGLRPLLRRVERARHREHGAPRPQPSLDRALEHRQRNSRAGRRQRLRDVQAAGRYLPSRRPDAADDLGLQLARRRESHRLRRAAGRIRHQLQHRRLRDSSRTSTT